MLVFDYMLFNFGENFKLIPRKWWWNKINLHLFKVFYLTIIFGYYSFSKRHFYIHSKSKLYNTNESNKINVSVSINEFLNVSSKQCKLPILKTKGHESYEKGLKFLKKYLTHLIYSEKWLHSSDIFLKSLENSNFSKLKLLLNL